MLKTPYPVLFTAFILFGPITGTPLSLNLPSCTLHLTTFSPTLIHWSESFIHSNPSNIYLIGSSTLIQGFPPSLSFHEECTLHIFVARNYLPTLKYFIFATYSSYPYRSLDFSTIIFVTQSSSMAFQSVFAQLPSSLFFYRIGATPFPNYFICFYCSRPFVPLQETDHFNSISSKTFSQLWVHNVVDINTWVYLGGCIPHIWAKNEPHPTCSVTYYTSEILRERQNISLTYQKFFYDCTHILYRLHGMICPSVHFRSYSVRDSGASFFQYQSVDDIYYCSELEDVPNLHFGVWFVPFQLQVWLALLLAVAMGTCFGLKSELTPGSVGLSMCRYYFRQDDSNSWLFLFIGFVMLKVTCLYENELTARVVVPEVVSPIPDIGELVAARYTILYRGTDYPEERRAHYLAELGRYNLLNASNFFIKLAQRPEGDHLRFIGKGKFALVDENDHPTSTKEAQKLQIIKFRLASRAQYCNRIKEPLYPRASYWFFYTHLQHGMIQTMAFLREGGFHNFFGDILHFRGKRFVLRKESEKESLTIPGNDSLITLGKLGSFLILCCIFLGVSLVLFFIEIRKCLVEFLVNMRKVAALSRPYLVEKLYDFNIVDLLLNRKK